MKAMRWYMKKKKIANVFIRFHFFSFFRPNNEKLGYDVKIDWKIVSSVKWNSI